MNNLRHPSISPSRVLVLSLSLVLAFGLSYIESSMLDSGAARYAQVPASVGFTRTDYPVAPHPDRLAAGDLNNDGNLDLAIANIALGQLTIFLGTGTGSFNQAQSYHVGQEPNEIAAADLNADGHLDIVTVNFNDQLLSVLLNRGNGLFQPAVNYGAISNGIAIAIGDYNGDGRPDIAAVESDQHDVILMRNAGDGSFFDAGGPAASYSPYDVSMADLNGDHKLDIVTANPAADNISVILNNGDGTFQPRMDYPVGLRATNIVVADFNHDGIPDLAVSISDSSGVGSVAMLLGNGDGTFAPAVDFGRGHGYGKLVTGDFNCDGIPDLAALSNDAVAIFVSRGDGTFQPPLLIPVGHGDSDFAVGDFNHDRKSDLIIANALNGGASGSISVLLNNCPQPPPTPVLPTATPSPSPTPSATPTPQPTICANPFVDITTNIFFHAINALYCQGTISGTDPTHYSPASTATRAQFAKIVVLGFALTLVTPQSGQTFTDVPPDYYAYLYIESGYANSILSGYDAASCQAQGAIYPCYLPGAAITRGQLTKLVVAAASYPLYTPTSGQTFSDVPPSNVFYVSIETAHNKGVINGYPDNTFRPNNPIRRDEMAQIVYKGITTR